MWLFFHANAPITSTSPFDPGSLVEYGLPFQLIGSHSMRQQGYHSIKSAVDPALTVSCAQLTPSPSIRITWLGIKCMPKSRTRYESDSR